jgi:hypothetical protein
MNRIFPFIATMVMCCGIVVFCAALFFAVLYGQSITVFEVFDAGLILFSSGIVAWICFLGSGAVKS